MVDKDVDIVLNINLKPSSIPYNKWIDFIIENKKIYVTVLDKQITKLRSKGYKIIKIK